MIRATVLALLCLVPRAATAEQWPSVKPQAMRAHVAFLADDALEGRATGSRGHQIAAQYVAAQMQSVGLRPGAGSGEWLQPVSMLEAVRVVPAAQASIRRGDENVELIPAVDFLPEPGFWSNEANVEAPVVFVGSGVSAPEFGYDDLAGVDLRGKIALFLSGLPPAIPEALHVHFKKQRAMQIAGRGAKGSVEIATPQQARESPWSRAVASARSPRYRLLGSFGQPADAYPELDAAIVLNVDSAWKVFAGAPKALDAIWADAEAGRPQSFELPVTMTIRTRTMLRKISSSNVVGLLEGSDPALANEYVVLMAHLDHVGMGAGTGGDTIYNGAIDNAVGVAVMLEAARILTSAEPRPRRSVLFLATTAEERGLLGSRQFAVSPTVRKAGIVAAVNIDMPVALYPAAGYTAVGAEHSTLGVAARRALESEGLVMLPIRKPERGLFAFTDQYSFVREGIPALYVHDVPVSADASFDAGQIFEGYLRNHYHKPSDDMNLPIDWAVLARLARVNARICQSIADDGERPRWLPGDLYGRRFGGP